MVIKAVATDSGKLSGTPAGAGLPFWVGVVAVIGFAMWGNEPDVWRYGKPSFWWPLPSYIFAGFWFLLFVVGGWMMAQLSKSTDFGAQMKYITHCSLFGAFWLAWILATISQFAINDGNYYESVNAGQNLVGAWRRWHRWLTCLIVAGGGVIGAWLVNFHFINGWFKVAGFLAVTVPCATVIMAVDHFLLPRLFRISRPLTKVPAWEETGFINVPAVAALLGAVFFGVTDTANWPNGWIYASEPNGWGAGAGRVLGDRRDPLHPRGRGRVQRCAEPPQRPRVLQVRPRRRGPLRDGGGHRLDRVSGRGRSP
jgi:hypothetical protein